MGWSMAVIIQGQGFCTSGENKNKTTMNQFLMKFYQQENVFGYVYGWTYFGMRNILS